jgi:hypothetical protein
MSSASTITSVAFIYRRDYTNKAIQDLTLRDHVWWAKIHKEGGFTGKSFSYPIPYAAPQGVSGTFSTARTNAKSSKGVQPEAYRYHKFGVITLDNEAILAARGSKGAFYDLVTRETDGILQEVGDSEAFDFYRDTYGTRGRISSIAGNVITLTDPADVRNFKPGMTVIADDISTGASPRSGDFEVVAVSPKAGTVTVDNIADITGVTANDYLFRAGDPATCMEGLEVCTPLSAPVYLTDSFRGIDRGAFPELLAGSRLDDTALNAEIALSRLAVEISLHGRSHNVDEAYVHPTHFFNMSQRLGAKVEYSDGGGQANFGFQSIVLHTAAGALRVFADPDCPLNRGRVSRNGTQYIKHLGDLPHIVDLDGNMSLRQTEDNGIETRVESYKNLIQEDTAAQGVCSLATS